MQALQILRNEHRTLAAVLEGLQHVVAGIRSGKAAPDFALLGAMIYYLDTFPERFHHPKEDAYLFRRLRERCQAARHLLDRLEAEHRAGGHKVAQLSHAFARYQSGGAPEFYPFDAIVEAYCAFQVAHIRTEEVELMPLAERFLTADDWAEIDRVFLDHQDPLFGVAVGDGFRDLFARIVKAAPTDGSASAQRPPE